MENNENNKDTNPIALLIAVALLGYSLYILFTL